MDTQDYLRNDTLDLHLYAVANPLAGGVKGVGPILEAINANAGALRPDQASVAKRTCAYSAEAVEGLLASSRSTNMVTLTLTRRADPGGLYSLSFIGGASPLGLWLRVVVPMRYFEEPGTSEQRSRAFVSLATALAGAGRPAYAFAHSKADISLGTDPHLSDPSTPYQVYEVYWLNVYGPEMVGCLGRDRVLATPAETVMELPEGGVLFLTRPTPADYATPEARIAQARALVHLRDDLTYEEALARLNRRSATLAPVARHWDPDLEDLLELTLDDVRYSERQTQIAKLNAYRPPEVTEWRPLQDLLPPDVADVAAAVDRYAGLYAEQLVALLHKQVPQVMQASPESLPLIDYHFWHFDYASEFKREDIESDLVPALGAYLGEVLVRNLGGRWVPRQNLDEAQVVLGDRAWLPFVRARHYMRSKQAALDYSLTKFYRTAERHLRSASSAAPA